MVNQELEISRDGTRLTLYTSTGNLCLGGQCGRCFWIWYASDLENFCQNELHSEIFCQMRCLSIEFCSSMACSFPRFRGRATEFVNLLRMQQISDQTPPFRADHVGSLLRTETVIAGRKKHFEDNAISSQELAAIEDEAIRIRI